MNNRQRVHKKIRYTISGTAARPRLAVYRSVQNMYAQLIDDTAGKTLGAASSLKMKGSLVKKAEAVGKEIATKAKALKITEVVYDRGGFGYKGAVKALCEAARQEGLKI